MLRNDFFHSTASLRFLSQIFGTNWKFETLSRYQQFMFITWRTVALLLNAVPNGYIFVQRTAPHFLRIFSSSEQLPMGSIIAILERVNKLVYNVTLHFLLVWTAEKTLKIFFDQLEPLYRALDKPALNKIRRVTNWSMLLVSLSVSIVLYN